MDATFKADICRRYAALDADQLSVLLAQHRRSQCDVISRRMGERRRLDQTPRAKVSPHKQVLITTTSSACLSPDHSAVEA